MSYASGLASSALSTDAAVTLTQLTQASQKNVGKQESTVDSQLPTREEAVAKDFESMFVSLLLKEMRQTIDGGLFAGDETDSYGALFDMFMGKHIAEANPLGMDQYISDITGTKTS